MCLIVVNSRISEICIRVTDEAWLAEGQLMDGWAGGGGGGGAGVWGGGENLDILVLFLCVFIALKGHSFKVGH